MIRYLICRILSEEEAEKFSEFVWGDDYKNAILQSTKTVELWNDKMGHILTINGSGHPPEDIPKMIEAWKNETK